MQPNKKYVRSDGVQYAMYPNPIMNITQSINGGYSHRGTNAIDDAQQNSGISNGYAPCDMVCVATDYVNGNAMFWQSQRPVVTRKYGVCTICIMVIHDNSANAYVGMKIPQGTQLFSEGTAGHATGNHNHIEVKVSPFTQMYVLNGYGVYMMPGNVNPADVFFVDDTQIINGGGLDWAKIPSESIQPSEGDLVQEDGIATLTVDSVQARLNSPTGSVVRKYNTGDEIRYYWKWVGNGHRYIVWKEGTNYIYLAVSNSEQAGVEPWATFRAPDDDAPNPNNPFNPDDLVQEDGIATFTVDSVRARLNDPNGKVVGTFNTGDKVRYYWKWVGSGHRYVVYKEGDDYVLVAISGSEEQGKDLWATFSAPDDTEQTPEPAPDPEPDPEPKPEFPDSVKFKGIDISEHNQSVDLNDVDFVIVRANWWTTTDKKFEEYTKMLEEKGIPYGVYCYDYCGDEETALEQAEYTYNLIKNKKIDLGVWMDMEDADGWKKKNNYLNKEHCTMVCKVFCDFFKERGYYTGIYASSSWFNSMIDELGYPKWIANWGTNDGTCQGDFSAEAVMHQYTSIPLDKNVIYVDMETMKSEPKEPEKPIDPEEPNKPEDPTDVENPEEDKENVDVSLVNKLLNALLELVNKILKIFK